MRGRLFGPWLLTLAALLTLPPLLSALDVYTVVLKDGRRLEAQSRYVVFKGVVSFTGTDGRAHRFPLSEVNLPATQAANQPAERPERKVWTNAEVESLTGRSPVNVMGTHQAAAPPAAESAAAEPEEATAGGAEQPPPEQTVEYWQEQLKPLRDELAQVEKQLQSLRQGLGRAPSNAIDPTAEPAGINVQDTIQRLETKRNELQEKIRNVQLQARRKGILPGKLR